jgi:prepilin-type N-terminal cleavage/methylation domain-containing protein
MHCSHERGFTLLEVVIALSLTAVMCTGVASLFVSSAHAVGRARTTTVGGLLVREKMEQLRALPFDDPALLPLGVDTLRDDFDGYCDTPLAGWKRRWSVVALPAYPAAGIVVEVDVINEGESVVARLVAIRVRKAV